MSGVGKEEVPKPLFLCLVFGPFEQFELALGVAPTIVGVSRLEELLLHRLDDPLEEVNDLVVEGTGLL